MVTTCSRPTSGEVDFAGHRALSLDTWVFLSLCRQISAVFDVGLDAPVASCLPHTSPVTFGQGWTELNDFEKLKRLLFLFF